MGVTNSYTSLLVDQSRRITNAIFPNEVEYYMVSLELLNSQEVTERFLTFPILPEEMRVNKVFLNNVQLTYGGIINTLYPNFVPYDITLSGSFGKKFRLLVGGNLISTTAISYRNNLDKGLTTLGSNLEAPLKVLNTQIKTGYGVCKILQGICDKSATLDKLGLPYTLILYNPTFNQNVVCVVGSYTFSQSLDSNMIWKYSLSLKAIAPLDLLLSQKNQQKIISLGQKDFLAKALNITASKVKSLL